MALTTAGSLAISCAEKQANGLIETVYLAAQSDIDGASTTVASHAVSAWAFTGLDKFEQVTHARGAARLTISDTAPLEGGRAVTGQLVINLQGLTAADLVTLEEIRAVCDVVAVVKYFDQKMFVLGFDAIALEEVAMQPGDVEGGSAEEFGGSYNTQLVFNIAQHEQPLEYTGTEAALTA